MDSPGNTHYPDAYREIRQTAGRRSHRQGPGANPASIEGFDRLVNSEELHQSITALHVTLDDFRQLVTNLDRQVEPVASNVNLTLDDARNALQKASSTLDDVRGTMPQADTTLQSADELFSDEQILTALDNALNEISSAAYAIRILAETINNQPESLIRGRH